MITGLCGDSANIGLRLDNIKWLPGNNTLFNDNDSSNTVPFVNWRTGKPLNTIYYY